MIFVDVALGLAIRPNSQGLPQTRANFKFKRSYETHTKMYFQRRYNKSVPTRFVSNTQN